MDVSPPVYGRRRANARGARPGAPARRRADAVGRGGRTIRGVGHASDLRGEHKQPRFRSAHIEGRSAMRERLRLPAAFAAGLAVVALASPAVRAQSPGDRPNLGPYSVYNSNLTGLKAGF